MHRDFFFRNFIKNNDECILILVIYWKKTENCINFNTLDDGNKSIKLQYFPAHKTHHDFYVRNFRKNNDEYILIIVIYWKKTGLSHTKISNPNIIYSS